MTKTEQVNNVLKDNYVYLNSNDSTLDFFQVSHFSLRDPNIELLKKFLNQLIRKIHTKHLRR